MERTKRHRTQDTGHLRICLLSQYPPQSGGIAVHAQCLAEGLAAKGHQVTVITYGKMGRKSGRVRIVETGGVNVFLLRGMCFSFGAFFKLRRMIARGEVDVVHAHPVWPAGMVALKARFLARRKVPVVMTSHGSDLLRHGKIPVFSWLIGRVARRADRLICVSGFLEKRAREMGVTGCPVVYNGIDAKNMAKRMKKSREQNTENRKQKTVLFVGALVPQKGPDIFMEMTKKISSEMPGVNFVVVGDGPMRAGLEKSAPGNVEFTGKLSHEKTMEQIMSADVLAVTSRMEGFGLAPLEALALGTPVVALPNGALPEILPGEFLAKDIAEAICSELETGKLKKIAAREGAKLAGRFTVEKMVSGTEKIYRSVLNGRKAEK